VPLDEVVPVVRCAVRTGLDAFLLENVPDRLPADPLDTKLAQFADDPRVAEPCGLRDLGD
jgi:hypothetical protein